MALSWSGRRQLLYYGVAFIVGIVLVYSGYEAFFISVPTCFDGKQNGDETGIDCGGSCSLVCPDVAHKPILLWARAFPTGGNLYTAAAYVQNSNVGAGVKSVRYAFQLFDANNSLVVERDGVTQLPPIQTIPIVETNIDAGNRTVARTLFFFTDEGMAWQKISAKQLPALHVTQQDLAPDGSRLSAVLVNDSLMDAKNIAVAAVLFDSAGVARAASKSILSVPNKSSQSIVFTWPAGIPNIVKAQITILLLF